MSIRQYSRACDLQRICRTSLATLALVTLSACGGGSSSSSSPPPAPPGTPSLSISGVSVAEGNSGTASVDVQVSLSSSSANTVTANYATSDGTAQAGSDYTADSGTISISAGDTTATITLQVISDTQNEGDETFTVQLSAPSNATIGNGSATISITDDDQTVSNVGLSSRPSNSSCLAPTRTTSGTNIGLVDAFPSLPDLPFPMKIVQPRNDSSVWFAVGRSGSLDRFSNNGTALERYLDITVSTAGEGGFLSAVPHPNWPTTKEMYVSYTVNDSGLKSRLSRLVINSDATLPASFTEEVLLTIDQPFSNHNGGDIDFGPDNALYYSMGDGGDGGDPFDYGQNTTRLLGNILRIDVLGVAFPSPGYNIPSGNPFASNNRCGPAANANNCPEIFAWGLRNPWRMSFDQSTGDLWVGDVGQGAREEVDIILAGRNYGWRCREGTQAFNTSGCPAGPFEEPVFDYDRSNGDRSITGGFVYRGASIASLMGKYIFADYISGRVWSLENQGGSYVRTELVDNNFNVAGLSQGNDGEVYVLNIGSGRVLRFTASGGTLQDNVADNLADTGCFDSSNPSLPEAGLVPYQPAAAFWSDGAVKQRWVALPNGTNIATSDPSGWTFPNGTVIAKHFELGGQLLETRLFMRHPDGEWAGYTYQWNDAETAATRVRNGATRTVGGQTWIYPSESDCLSCHTQAAGFVLGLESAQINNDFLYPSTGITDNQLEVFNHINLFSSDVPEPVANLPALADPTDSNAALDDRARAYLHTNCAQCHQPGGPTGVDMDLRFDTSFADTGLCDVVPQAGTLGIGNARLLAPGEPGRSILVARTDRRDADGMPPLASNQIDNVGVALLSDWVNSITSCP